MRNVILRLLVPAVLVLLVAPGCGQRAAQQEATQPADVPLPEWAPENPSPEFLRAARVIKPWPEEFTPASSEAELTRKALHHRYISTLPAAWEFFGTLTDEQIERFLSAKSFRLRFVDLSGRQRTALLSYFDVFRESMKGLSPEEQGYSEDPLVELYKLGAKEDLSNVEIEFLVRASGIVAIFMRARQPDGSLSPPAGVGLGYI
ncbi:MAG: hypothetical protein OEV33_02190 [Armatimonadota bacterium]|nr:hypothetical protein [Armatimonadota bacterium]